MKDAEWQFDTNAYLQEQRWLAHGRLQCKYLCQQTFLHAAATGQSEHDHAIHRGQRKQLPKWDLGVEPTATELVTPDSTCQHMEDLYWDVYQLHRLPRRGQCKEAMEKHTCKEILDSIKECLWLKWPSTQLEGEWSQLPYDAPWPDFHNEFAAVNCSMHGKFAATKWNSYEEMMALTRDSHQ